MRDYFIRRFLLIPPTLLGVVLLVFIIVQFVPGGPMEQRMMEMQSMDSGGRGARSAGQGMALSEEQMQRLKEYYGFDKPIPIRFINWVGKAASGDLGESVKYGEPVTSIIRQRMPVSIFYGLLTLCITYSVCIPLGVMKAIRHRTFVDNSTSVLIFFGYSIPGYAMGALLILFFSIRMDWFPTGGFTSIMFDTLEPWEKVKDLFHHAVLPLSCYLISSFAVTTMLMKNQLMDNLAADYVRTAMAKGCSFRQAVLRHAMRNSLIPIATTFGQNVTLLVGGSFLIESIFDIEGFGLLGLTSILNRDYPIVIGVVFLSSGLLMLGNILSDMLVAVVDPRIRFK
ncbi:MAG: ABC transporter permease [Verrucomicrobiota bacterium]|nr:ABC transporter permease [Verrucomicrobiota bacterium]